MGVDLAATVSGTATGETRYAFDCTDDGTIDASAAASQSAYTAADACDYPAAGTYTARVRVEREGVPAEQSLTITVSERPPTLAEIILEPSAVSLDTGATQQFTATGRMSDGSTVSVSPVFSATGGTITGNGLYTAGTTAGTYRVIAAVSASLADTASVTITPPPPVLTQIILAPESVTLEIGQMQQFGVMGLMSDGSTTSVNATYTATGGTITPGGLYTAGQTLGNYRVIATLVGGALADTSAVTVTLPPLGIAVSICRFINWWTTPDPCYGNGTVFPIGPDKYDVTTEGRSDRGFSALYRLSYAEGTALLGGGPVFADFLIEDPFIGQSPISSGTVKHWTQVIFSGPGPGKSVFTGTLFAPDTVIMDELCIGIDQPANCPKNAIATGGTITVDIVIRDRDGNVIPDFGTIVYDPTQCGGQGCYTETVTVSSTRGLRAWYWGTAYRECNVSGTLGCQAGGELHSYWNNQYVPGTVKSVSGGLGIPDTDRIIYEVRADDGLQIAVKRVHVYVQR